MFSRTSKTITNRVQRIATKSLALLDRREQIHFLHISKNAGTQIKHLGDAINRSNRQLRIVMHQHSTRLSDLPRSQRYFFSIRSPESRFYSGFYSRKRKGAPRHFHEWTANEACCYRDFEHANDLAESLSDQGPLGDRAIAAMKSVFHTSVMQIDWLGREGYFLELRPPVHIIRQDRFDNDLSVLLRKLHLSHELSPSNDPVVAHRNHYGTAPALSQKARENLAAWYIQDVEFYNMCDRWLRDQGY